MAGLLREAGGFLAGITGSYFRRGCPIHNIKQDPHPAQGMDPFMRVAMEEARKGMTEGGIPIGSVLVRNTTIIGRGHNRRVQQENPMIHAEIDCLMQAGRIGSYGNTILYSTLMPCFLCAGAAVQFGIKKVIVAESRNFLGARAFMEEHGI